jgi:HD-like signal output (HDOD) protein
MISMKRLFQRPSESADTVTPNPVSAAAIIFHALPHQALIEKQFVDLLLEGSHKVSIAGTDTVLDSWCAHFDNILGNAAARHSVTPYFPSVLPKLMRLLRNPDAPAQSITTLVSSDATLAGNVLRLANSPMLRTSSQGLDSLQKATTLLGFQGMYALVAASVMEPVILRQSRQHPRLAQRLWRHGLCSAHLLQTTGDTDSEGRGIAYLAGLLHGIGTTIVCNEIERHAEKLGVGRDESELFHTLISEYGNSLTIRVAEDWQLPPSLLEYLQTGTGHAASLRLQRASLAVKAGMLIEHRRMLPETLEQVCGEAQSDMGRRVMQLLQRQ